MHESSEVKIKARNGLWKGQRRIDPFLESDFKFVWGFDAIAALDRPAGETKGLTGTYEGYRKKRELSQKAYELWKSAVQPEDVAQGYEGLRDGYERMLLTNFPLPKGVKVSEEEFYDVQTLSVNGGAVRGDGRSFTILHFHGGGFLVGSAKGSLEYAYRLAKIGGGKVITVDYRLAPENPYPAALDDAMLVYRGLIANGLDPKQIILSGESAGAGLVLSLTAMIIAAKLELPAGLLIVCPMADMTISGESVAEFDGYDAAASPDILRLMAEAYFQGHEPLDPFVSPVFGRFDDFPPMFVTASRDEVLRSDAERVINNAKLSGVAVTEFFVDDSVHVYPIFPFLPETTEFLSLVDKWLRTV